MLDAVPGMPHGPPAGPHGMGFHQSTHSVARRADGREIGRDNSPHPSRGDAGEGAHAPSRASPFIASLTSPASRAECSAHSAGAIVAVTSIAVQFEPGPTAFDDPSGTGGRRQGGRGHGGGDGELQQTHIEIS